MLINKYDYIRNFEKKHETIPTYKLHFFLSVRGYRGAMCEILIKKCTHEQRNARLFGYEEYKLIAKIAKETVKEMTKLNVRRV